MPDDYEMRCAQTDDEVMQNLGHPQTRALLAAAKPREKMVAILALQGLSKMDIADALSVCPRRVEQILNKLAGIASGLGADDGMSSDLFQGGV